MVAFGLCMRGGGGICAEQYAFYFQFDCLFSYIVLMILFFFQRHVAEEEKVI